MKPTARPGVELALASRRGPDGATLTSDASVPAMSTDRADRPARSPRFAVVVPLYNKEAEVERALCSVLAQRVADFEVIVVDDGSTDASLARAENVRDPRIRAVRQPNAGVSAARNRGIRESAAPFVCFLDADDEWHPCFLEAIEALIRAHPEAGLYATGYEVVEADGSRFAASVQEEGGGPGSILPSYFRLAARGVPPVCASAACVPRRVLDEVGAFAEGVNIGEDLDLWGRIALRHPVARSGRIGAVYHRDANDRSSVRNAYCEPPFVFARTLARVGPEIRDPQLARDAQEYVAFKLREDAAFRIWFGDPAAARPIARELPWAVAPSKKLLLLALSYLPLGPARRLPTRLYHWVR